MANHTAKKSMGILCDVLVRVAFFIFQAYFVTLDYKVGFEVIIILERPFLVTGRVLIDVKTG